MSAPRTTRRTAAVLLASLALLLVARPSAAAEPWSVEWNGQRTSLECSRERREEYVRLADVATFFGLQRQAHGRKEVTLTHAQGRITVYEGRALVLVNDQSVLLRADVIERRREVWVPLDFLTSAVARLFGVQARRDDVGRLLRFDSPAQLLACDSFADRTRVTLRTLRAPEFSEVVKDGRRRVLVLTNQELPAQVGGCLFDDTLQDLEIRPAAGQTRLTFFVGPRFTNLKVYELPDTQQVVFDFFNDSGAPIEAAPVAPPANASPRDVFDTIVLDPGHGGEDRGAVGAGGLEEKALVLSIATTLAQMLRDRGGLQVVLTRGSDESVPLSERTVIANRSQADLFLSLHANATSGGGARGAETYYLDLEATDEASRTLAAQENDATGVRRRGGGGDELELVLWDMAQQQYLEESARLADALQRELNELAGTKDRGVKQANFAVLRGATMPAVLVEVGFLSDAREEARMKGADFRRATAEALFRAIIAFRDQRQARQAAP